jgi:16S rRNA (adenine1518-N6/adenine1519-N6)-dimethyltransferase
MRKAKALGQHFLTSRRILGKIIGVISPRKDELIIEIGGGKGALTFPLAEACAKLITIEKDRTLTPILRAAKKDNLVVLEEDILRVDFRRLLAAESAFGGRAKLVGNLPYMISSPVLFKVLEERELFSKCVFLLQKEVAARITSPPGSKDYAPLSIFFQRHFEIRLCFSVPPGAFSPPPKVQSALVAMKKRGEPLYPVGDEAGFRLFLKAAFAHRRKTLANNLKAASFEAPLVLQALERFGLGAKARAEQLSIAQFAALFEHLASDTHRHPIR